MATTETTTSPSFPQRVTSWPARVKDYFADLQQEMRRVTWPTSKQVRATTGVVIATVFAFAAYFFVVDYFIGKGVNKLYDVLTK